MVHAFLDDEDCAVDDSTSVAIGTMVAAGVVPTEGLPLVALDVDIDTVAS